MEMKTIFCVLATLSAVISYPVHWDGAMSCKERFGDGFFKILSNGENWDHYIFVQQYPAGVCSVEGSQSCRYPANASSWTMHGLWPTLGDTKQPNFCNESEVFDISEIKDLVPKLEVEWTNLRPSSSYYSFWSHEWCKHGSCSAMSDEHTFFKTILDYYENGMQFGDILDQGGVLPSDSKTYSLDDIVGAFYQRFQANPYSVTCMGSKQTGSVLTQIGVCLDKSSWDVIACPSPPVEECSKNSIQYPTSMYHHGGH